jgi:hypothetical protein
MTKKIGDKKISGVKAATKASSLQETGSVSNVQSVKRTAGVGGVQATGGVAKRGATRAMTYAERQEFLRLIDEEADKMAAAGILPASKKEILKSAVRMTVQASEIDASETAQESQSKKK